MTLIQLAAVFFALITAIGWLNARVLHLPQSAAMLGAGILAAVILLAAQTAIAPFWGFDDVRSLIRTLDFREAVLDYLLGALLFAGGLQADLTALRRMRVAVWTLATLGVVLSTVLVGGGVWAAGKLLGADLPLAWALAFGALISPTDPVAVIGAVKSGAVSIRLGAVLQGEALFNDGVGFLAFSVAVAFASSGAAPHPSHVLGALLLEAGGGLVLGAVLAYALVFALRAVDDRVTAVAATIALALGVYALAGLFHLSGPIAAATAGLVMGETGMKTAVSEETRRYVEGFWDLVDQMLNALLFLLLGLQVFVLRFHLDEIGLWIIATALACASRLLVIAPWGAYFRLKHAERGASLILTWGGLRGAVSLALALTLPHGPYRDPLIAMTFVVVIFSVIVQGLTFTRLAARLRPA